MRTERLRCACTLGLARPGVGRFGGGVGWGSRRSLPDGRQQVRGFLLPRIRHDFVVSFCAGCAPFRGGGYPGADVLPDGVCVF